MAEQEYVEILKQGVDAWKKWCAEHPGASLNVNLEEADLRGANLARLSLSHARLRGANLSGATLANAKLVETDFSDANLRGAILHGANLDLANLRSSDLSETDLRHARLRDAKLEGASLIGASLDDGDLWRANLTRANLERASLRLAYVNEATLKEVNFRYANLLRTKLDHSSLEGADLAYASLEEADLTETILTGADFSHVVMQGTILNNVGLSSIKGLEKVKHVGRSFVDTLTLHRANGRIPLSFLQGAGLPDGAINYAQTAAKTNMRASCFLCYTSGDLSFVTRLSADLQLLGIRCWLMNMLEDQRLFLDTDNTSRIPDKYLLVIPQEILHGGFQLVMVPHMLEWEQQVKMQLLIPLYLKEGIKEEALQWWKEVYSRSWKMAVIRNRMQNRQPLLPDRTPLNFSQWQDEEAYQRALQLLVEVLE
ncbi:MAG TPA: pentapeptide repeat-containing protein [Ktedonobacteraceae bacterium]|nr:pentapeptide repeat-containing protein [Ktedonobacteraceae bacterium]